MNLTEWAPGCQTPQYDWVTRDEKVLREPCAAAQPPAGASSPHRALATRECTRSRVRPARCRSTTCSRRETQREDARGRGEGGADDVGQLRQPLRPGLSHGEPHVECPAEARVQHQGRDAVPKLGVELALQGREGPARLAVVEVVQHLEPRGWIERRVELVEEKVPACVQSIVLACSFRLHRASERPPAGGGGSSPCPRACPGGVHFAQGAILEVEERDHPALRLRQAVNQAPDAERSVPAPPSNVRAAGSCVSSSGRIRRRAS